MADEQREAPDPDGGDGAEMRPLLEAVAGLLIPTLHALDMLRFAARHLHPPHLGALAEAIRPAEQPMLEGREAFRAAVFPERLHRLRDGVLQAVDVTGDAVAGFGKAALAGDMREVRRALRLHADACEALWPLARISPAISRFFLDDVAREDEAVCERLESADPERTDAGVFHFDNERGSRGGYSLFVPGIGATEAPPPLVVALHGGSGHGRAFFWNWLPAARAAGVMLVAPTSMDRTWALQGEDVDTPNLARILSEVGQTRRYDHGRVLMTGMSDGGTFCWTSGLLGDSAFTHLAPFSATFHPLLLEFADADRLRGLPVHIVHGALDWMFPADIAHTAARALEARGAQVVHREIPDLSHAFATDEAPAVLRWFLGSSAEGR